MKHTICDVVFIMTSLLTVAATVHDAVVVRKDTIHINAALIMPVICSIGMLLCTIFVLVYFDSVAIVNIPTARCPRSC